MAKKGGKNGRGCKLWMLAALLAFVGLGVFSATAEVTLEPLNTTQMAYRGATHKVEVEWDDFTVTDNGAAQTNTVTLSGPCAWKYSGWSLETPFDDTKAYIGGLPTTTNSIAMTVLIGSVTAVSAVQVAQDASPIYRALMPIENTITNVYSGVLTNGQSVTVTCVIGSPSAANNLDRMTSGRAAAYFRIWP